MLFATFQPNSVVKELEDEGAYAIKEYHFLSNGCGIDARAIEERVGYKPIFAFPLTDKRDFLTRCLMEFPSMPQNMIIFKSNKLDTVGYLKWLQYISCTLAEENYIDYPFDVLPEDLQINNRKVFNEFVVPKIEMKNVKKIVSIADIDNVLADFGVTCCDEYQEYLYSDGMRKVLSKYFPKDNSFLIPTYEVDAKRREEVITMLTNLTKATEKITDKYIFEVYNKIKSYYTR